MPAAARFGDTDTGHDACGGRPNVQGSPNVTINGRPAHRKGDAWGSHGCPDHPPHGAVTVGGSGTVTINGKPAARVGDGVSCGGSIATGSGNVTIGG